MNEMAADYCFGEDYNNKFDAKSFLKAYYSSFQGAEVDGGLLPRTLEFLHTEFSNHAHHQGKRFLDVGTGPSICTILSASKVYSDITLAEYSEMNRNELHSWINKEEDAYDWGSVLSYISALEKTNSIEALECRARDAIKEVLPCDILQANPLHPNLREPYDCVMTSLCLEVSSKDIQSYRESVKNLSTLVKPNGVCLVAGVLGESFYGVGQYKFFTLPLSKNDITSAFMDAGFVDIDIKCHKFSDTTEPDPTKPKDISDLSGFFLMYAKKA